MTKNETETRVRKCLQLIETRLAWGTSEDWTNYDFSKLSDEVHNRTQVRLSVTTLKRLWGKLKYDNDPTLTTLNTLARFAGFDDWRTYCQKVVIAEPVPVEASAIKQQQSHQRLSGYWFLTIIPLALIAIYSLTATREQTGKLDPIDFEFRADKVKTEGVPNSVVFNYEASAAETDSVFIVQTWDITRKKLVAKSNHVHSAIYYYPGFFNTKLIADGQIVKTHDLWITSDGWLALIEQESVPLYFKKEEFTFNDRIEINEGNLKKYNLALHPNAPGLRFFNQRDLGDIMNDNFIFETSVRTEFNDGAGACQSVYVLIQCKNDIIYIPLSAKSCVGELVLYYSGQLVKSTDADLSKFGSDLREWTTLRVETVNKHVTCYVNGEKAYELDFPNMPTGIVGLQYRFAGVGAVKDTKFEWGEKVVKL